MKRVHGWRVVLIVTLCLLPISLKGQENRGDFQRSRLTSDRSEGKADKRRLLLSTGEDKVVDLDFDVNLSANGITVGNPKVVLTTLVRVGDQRQLVFKPLGSGKSTVTVRDAEGNVQLIFDVRVTESNLQKIATELRDLLKDIEGLQIRVLGKKVIVDGEVLVPNDYGRLLSVIIDGGYQENVLNLVALSPIAMRVLAKRIQRDVNAFAPNVNTRVVNGQIWLEGTTDTIEIATRCERVALLYFPDAKPGASLQKKDPGHVALPPRSPIQNFIVVNPPPPQKQEDLVRVTVHFVELQKDYKKFFGFKWQPGFTAEPTIQIGSTEQGGVGAGASTFTATISSLFPKLQTAQTAGYARILKTGTIIVRSGKAAKLVDETEIPFTQVGANGQVVSATAGVGLSLAVTPLILGTSEDIELDMNLSQVNLGPRSGNVPTTSKHEIQTKLYVKNNESAAIAGVNSQDVQTNFNKDDPSQISFADPSTSPLFTLLRSKSYDKKKAQFVIFVTPQVVENASQGTQDLKKNFRVKVN